MTSAPCLSLPHNLTVPPGDGWSLSAQYLLPNAVLLPVTGDLFKVVRDPSCPLMVDENLFKDSIEEDFQIVKVSRVQFHLTRVGAGVALVDKSMNGTYVDHLLVGKDKHYIVPIIHHHQVSGGEDIGGGIQVLTGLITRWPCKLLGRRSGQNNISRDGFTVIRTSSLDICT